MWPEESPFYSKEYGRQLYFKATVWPRLLRVIRRVASMDDGEEPAFNPYWATHFGLSMDTHHPVHTEMHMETYCDLKYVMKNIMYGTDETNQDHDVYSLLHWKRIRYVEAASCCEEILTWAEEYDDCPVHPKSEYSGPRQSYPTCVQAELVDLSHRFLGKVGGRCKSRRVFGGVSSSPAHLISRFL
jgi:hypothetical protein